MAVATNSLRAWVLASRPKTLGAITCPILLGNALAFTHGLFSWTYFFVILVNGILLQILANIVNDYGDFLKGSDKEDRLGPPRAMQMGWITKSAMIKGIVCVLLCAAALGLWLVFSAGPLVFFIGAIAIMLCLGYTLGPWPLAYVGFAEIVIFIVFGPMTVVGAYFVQTKSISTDAIVLSLSPGFLCAALLLTNNARDIVQDRKNRKRTLAVRYGERFARVGIVALIVLAMSSPILGVVFFSLSPLALISCAAFVPPLRHVAMILHEPISARFNLMLASIGKSLYLFGILFSLGIVYGAS